MKCVFVTVGTTSFDELIAAVSSPAALQVLQSRGYQKLVLQVGRGELQPALSNSPALELETFRFKDSLAEDLRRADLVISHAGAGSCLETLEEGRPLIVVINEKLMNNHQLELAKRLHRDGHVLCCNCSTLVETLQSMDLSTLKPFPPGQPEKFLYSWIKFLGFNKQYRGIKNVRIKPFFSPNKAFDTEESSSWDRPSKKMSNIDKLFHASLKSSWF